MKHLGGAKTPLASGRIGSEHFSSPLKPFPLPLEQAGEGDPWGLMTGAKALFCLTAGNTEEENGRMEEALEEPTVGLEDITAEGEKKERKKTNKQKKKSEIFPSGIQ